VIFFITDNFMAQRRMFSPAIVESDAFLDMPSSSQALYFHLGMYADDDGFVNPKKIMRIMGASDDDIKVLIGKRFVLPFDSGVIVIKHWRINNLIRKDWHKDTNYIKEKNALKLKDNGSYTELVNESLTFRQHSIVKNSIVKNSLEYIAEDTSAEKIEVIPNLLEDKQKHIKIIGLFARAKGTNFTSKEQQSSFIKRNLRPAQLLIGYELDRIMEVMKYLKENADFKWTLETVGKYIDDNLDNLNKHKIQVI
jgi:hypothetical protein